ncbi:hypothetical protein CROQUDRAFT_92805 [Cronartium quercuum f. sp. fusiforme G11]|uniref:Uncharacterized protein n=1 Tax=Cronartium quercuum f. sp. fusiforme G11 TaxID=708437 RepID=A0A9P6NLI9_9BASI|nr:hypothetical protein CROQUDRAFT_92805 [Cronartium quercuum f. sp. fusiforme G11]
MSPQSLQADKSLETGQVFLISNFLTVSVCQDPDVSGCGQYKEVPLYPSQPPTSGVLQTVEHVQTCGDREYVGTGLVLSSGSTCLDWVLHPQVGCPGSDALRWHLQSLQAKIIAACINQAPLTFCSKTKRATLEGGSFCCKIYVNFTESSKDFRTFEQPKTPI